MSDVDLAITSTAQSIGELLDAVLTDLGILGAKASQLMDKTAKAIELEQLRPLVEQMLGKYDGLIHGAGLATAPGCLQDEETWLQWWRLDGTSIVFTPHNLNPASLNYYDYTEMTWFERPAASGRPEVTGPYIDFGGTDTKVITVALPVEHAPGQRSIAGADLSMDHLEQRFLRSFGAHTQSVALVSESGKIITSNDARVLFGSRLNADDGPTTSYMIPTRHMDPSPWHIAAW